MWPQSRTPTVDAVDEALDLLITAFGDYKNARKQYADTYYEYRGQLLSGNPRQLRRAHSDVKAAVKKYRDAEAILKKAHKMYKNAMSRLIVQMGGAQKRSNL